MNINICNMIKSKPLVSRPQLYATYFHILKEIAMECGYNLVVHGSLNRDLDLIAIPWINEPKTEIELLNKLSLYLTNKVAPIGMEKEFYYHGVLPGGRNSYIINLNRGDSNSLDDPQYYLDISITPLGL